MCKYCDMEKGNAPSCYLINDNLDLGVFGNDKYNMVVVLWDDEKEGALLCADLINTSYEGTIKINYCPMCGRKLRE